MQVNIGVYSHYSLEIIFTKKLDVINRMIKFWILIKILLITH